MAPEPALSAFRDAFELPELVVRETSRWTVSVRPQQPTLGSVVVAVRRELTDLGGLEPVDGGELTDLLGWYETVARERFGAVRLNVLALMMKDPLVHVHVLPRYDGPVERHDLTWSDDGWPGPPQIAGAQGSRQQLLALRDELRDLA